MIESEGELRPLHYVLNGWTRQAWLDKQRQIDANRRVQMAHILSIYRKRCDELVNVKKDVGDTFIATCMVKGRQKTYEESMNGLE